MPVQITCKFDEIQSKVKVLSCPRHFPYCKSMGKNVRRSRASNYKVDRPSWPKIKDIPDIMPVLVTCKTEEYPIKSEDATVSPEF